MSDAHTKPCPICKASMPLSERYPLAICNAHYGECRDMQENMVTYQNEDEFGGFVSYHTIGEKIIKRNDGACFVQGITCIAEEARMGGIVIQLMRPLTK